MGDSMGDSMVNGQVYTATPEQVAKWIDTKAMPWVEASRPLIVGMYKGECGCILGTVPCSMLGDSAYLWLWNAPDVPKVVFARHAIKVMPKLLTLYSELICNCYNPDSARWLRSLGAVCIGPDLFAFRRL